MLYLMSLILLLVVAILKKQSEKKRNIVNTVIFGVILLLGYNVVICFFLNMFHLPIRLFVLGGINIALSLIFGITIYREKQIQKYYLHKSDLVYVCLIILTVGVLAYQNFGFPFQIKYETSDPYVHARAAILFADRDTLLDNVQDGLANYDHFMPGAYINPGLCIKALGITGIDRCQIFLGFSIIMFLMTALGMYTCLNRKDTKRFGNFFAWIATCLFLLGYPLNSMLFGFEYLSMAILAVIGILKLLVEEHKGELTRKQVLAPLFIFNMLLFLSYYFFVPFIYMGVFIYWVMKQYEQNRKIMTKKLFLECIGVFLVPFLWGAMYLILPGVLAKLANPNLKAVTDIAKLNGTIYKNMYSNILLLVPFVLYMIHTEKKQTSPVMILILANLIFIGLSLLCLNFKYLSEYYVMKNYYILWIFLFYAWNEGFQRMLEKKKALAFGSLIIYVTLLVLSFCYHYSKEIRLEISKRYEEITSVAEIYNINKTMLVDSPVDVSYAEIELIKKASTVVDFGKNVEIIGRYEHAYWLYTMTGYTNVGYIQEIYRKGRTQQSEQQWIQNPENEYVIYFTRSPIYEKYGEKIKENREVLYECETGGILVRK